MHKPRDGEDQNPDHKLSVNQPDEASRRDFLRGLSGIFAVAAMNACTSGLDEEDQSKDGSIVDDDKIDTPEEMVQKLGLPKVKEMIMERYPDLKIVKKVEELDEQGLPKLDEHGKTIKVEKNFPKFRDLAMDQMYEEDFLVKAYFSSVSYQQMKEDGVIVKTDLVERMDYLHTENKMWPEKLRIVCENHKKDMDMALANLEQYDTEHPQRERMTYQKFVDIASQAVKEVCSTIKTLKLENPDSRKYDLCNDFTELIDTDFLVGLSIHETMPTDYNDVARIALLRALFDEGFEINKLPAIGDDVASFGPLQMSVMPYEGRNRDNPFGAEIEYRDVKVEYTDKKGNKRSKKESRKFFLVGDIEPYLEACGLPHQLCDCIDLKDQLKAGMLLLLTNFRTHFSKVLNENERVKQLWAEANLVDRRTFLATLLGTAHNNPANARRTIEQAVDWSRKDNADYFVDDNPKTHEEVKTLNDLKIAYINIAKRGHSTSGREGHMTSQLIEAFSKMGDYTEVQLVAQSPQKPVETTPEKPDTGIEVKKVEGEEYQIKHVNNLLVRTREGIKYFTFTLPNWKLEHVLEDICTDSNEGMVKSIKKFNRTEHFKPGDVVLVPVSFMQEELRNPELVQLTIPKNKDKAEYLKEVLKPGVHPDIVIIYSAREKVSDLSDLENVVKIPKSLIKEDVLSKRK